LDWPSANYSVLPLQTQKLYQSLIPVLQAHSKASPCYTEYPHSLLIVSVVMSRCPSASSCHHHSLCSASVLLFFSWKGLQRRLCTILPRFAFWRGLLLRPLAETCLGIFGFCLLGVGEYLSRLWFLSHIFLFFHPVHLHISTTLLSPVLPWSHSMPMSAPQHFPHLHLSFYYFAQVPHT